MRIKTKIVTLVFLAVTLSVVLMAVSMYLFVNPILSRQTIRDNQAIVEKIAQQISYTLDDTITYAKGIIVNDQLQTLLKRATVSKGYDYFSSLWQINSLLKEYGFLRDNIIVDMSVIDPHNKPLLLSGVYYSQLNESWFDPFRNNNTFNGVSMPHVVVAPSNTSSLYVMTYVINIYDKQNPSPNVYLGKLLIHLDYNALIKPMLVDPSLGIAIAAYNQSNQLIYAPDRKASPVPGEILNGAAQSQNAVLKSGQYYLSETIPSTNWKITGTISKRKINANITYFNYTMVYIFLICLLFMWIIIYPVAANVTKPLLKLVRGMRQVGKGEFQTHIEVKSGDEIEEAAQVFNRMVKDIKNLIDESVEREKKERELGLKMFMLQINPHFIANTLNAIMYLARKANAPDIVRLTKAFISFMQSTLYNHPGMLASISDEIRYINDYSLILKYRYNDSVEVIWQVEESCKAYKIPKMILYPLVENSIFHGLLPALRKGWVRIGISEDAQLLRVSVADNGIGIAPETLEKLQAQLASPSVDENTSHIGLLNANNRLRLLFGEAGALQIESAENEGTRVSFSLPLMLLEHDPKNV
ncbi:sensor histidine kinase [Paenibacillus humicola]|uniref:sensor histidine kinase n=1 Tax=Paenibacillus humicola TaxID=3110540 RepID=UPI00237B8738|nr:sensor histidine kinase [Paenibacillus humicola]